MFSEEKNNSELNELLRNENELIDSDIKTHTHPRRRRKKIEEDKENLIAARTHQDEQEEEEENRFLYNR